MLKAFDARKTKRCPVCLKQKLLTEFGVRMRHKTSGRPYYNPYCRPCRLADRRARYSTSTKQREVARARSRERWIAHKKRVVVDEEYAAQYAVKRARWGATRKAPRIEVLAFRDDENEMPRLPVGPVVAFIDRLVAQHEPIQDAYGQDIRERKVLDSLRINPRTMYAWRHGERDGLNFDLVDRLLLDSGVLWFDIYDEDLFPEAYRVAERVFDPPLEEAA